MMRLGLFCLIFVVSAQAAEVNDLTALKGVQQHTMKAQANQHTYHVFVDVPENIPAGQKLPTVYLLDGGNTFPMLTPYAKYLKWVKDVPPMIIVGISYGTADWRKGNKRSTDYTLPAKDREDYGGAEAFHDFLTQELMPKIESAYPSDPKQRLLFGHSLGGQYALFSAMFKPDTFHGLIASNPAIHRNTELFLQEPAESHQTPQLVVVQAENDDPRYQKPRKQWLEHWQSRPHHWQHKVIDAPDHNHMSSVPVAFREGMRWLYRHTPQS